MTAKLGSLLLEAARSLEASLDAAAVESVVTWLSRLEDWNARIDLTAARTQEELVDLMVADALVLAAQLPEGLAIIDVGTGAGGPGLALAIFRRDLRLTLVEPQGKRLSFLRTVTDEIGRRDIMIERTRGESLGGVRTWDMAVSRATLPPAPWLDLGVKLVSPAGMVWVLLARGEPPSHPHAVIEKDVAYQWPLTGVRRRAVGYRVKHS